MLFPELGPLLNGKVISLAQHRYLPIAKNIVFSRVEQNDVFVLRILGSQMDYLKILGVMS